MAVEIKKGNIGYEKRQKEQDLKLSLVQEASEREVAIELLIRERYSLSQELGLHRKKSMGYLSEKEWKDYCDYVEECIDRVNESESA